MNLHEVNRGVRKNKSRKRVGRGVGSGHGKTSGRGHKGQGALAGWTSPTIFEGGKMPLIRRIPKRGFNNRWGKTVAVVNISDLEDNFKSGDEVNLESLRTFNLAKGRFDVLKILGEGELSKKLKVSAHAFSRSAQEKIEKAGGQVNVIPAKITVAEKRAQADAK